MSHTMWFPHRPWYITRMWWFPYFTFASHKRFMLLSISFCRFQGMNCSSPSISFIRVYTIKYIYTSSSSSLSSSSSMTCLWLPLIVLHNWARMFFISIDFFALVFFMQKISYLFFHFGGHSKTLFGVRIWACIW